MKTIRRSLACGAISLLVLSAGCTKKDGELGSNDALVADKVKNNSSPKASPDAVAPAESQAISTSSSPSVAHAFVAPKRVQRRLMSIASAKTSSPSRVAYETAGIVAERSELAGSISRSPASVQVVTQEAAKRQALALFRDESDSPNPDPKVLVARASERLSAAKKALQVNSRASANESSVAYMVSPALVGKIKLIEVAETAAAAIELMNQQPVPTDPLQRTELTRTRLSALAIRAEALRLVAATVDRDQADKAATATSEYIAAEIDVAKKASAEVELAAMYYLVNDLPRARSAYEKLLDRRPDDRFVLGRLAIILNQIAEAQEKAGDRSEAEASRRMAALYLSRIEPLGPSREPNVTAATSVAPSTEKNNVGMKSPPDLKPSDKAKTMERNRPALRPVAKPAGAPKPRGNR